jgi:sugar phosphate isomerase/epimerase
MQKRIFVHIPYRRIKEFGNKVVEMKLHPEIYFSAKDLDEHPIKEITETLSTLVKKGAYFTIHAPFMDLNPGSIDSKIRSITLERWLQLLPIIDFLKACTVVIHPGFDHWRYGTMTDEWMQLASQTIQEVMEQYPPSVTLAVENIFDKDPWVLKGLLELVNHPRVGHCFDVGHFLLFSKTDLETWFYALGAYMTELHLHDNQGDRDSHLGIGQGIAPWEQVFSLVRATGKTPLLTIEARTQKDAMISLEYLHNTGFLSRG